MKQLSLIVISILCAGVTFAQKAEVRITITGENYPSLSTDNVYLMQNTWYSSAKDTSDVVKMMNASTQVNVYAISPTLGNLSTMQTNVLEGTYIGFYANSNTNYKMTFDWLEGALVLIRDTYENKEFYATSDKEYTFSVAQAKQTYNDRFLIAGIHTPGDFSICHQYGKLIMDDNPYTTTNIVVKNTDGETVIDQPSKPVHQEIVVDTLPAGHYTVEFDGGAKEYVIFVNPMVTPETPVVP